MTVVLGINAYHSNASSALLVDGRLVAAVEEERFTRMKYDVAFPASSIRFCLDAAGMGPGDIDHVAVAGNPLANVGRKLRFVLSTRAGRKMAPTRLDLVALLRIKRPLAEILDVDPRMLRARVHMVEHHLAHMSSAYYASPYETAAVASLDGFGDMVSAMWGTARGSKISVMGEVNFPHSLGWFYLAFTQYLGFRKYGEEYKVMGLSSYGEPEFLDAMRDVVRIEGMHYRLNMLYFRHLREIQPLTWRQGTPVQPPVWDEGMVRTFGAVRSGPDEPIEQRHRNVAASLQRRLEEVVLRFLSELQRRTGLSSLCLAGGVALNAVANGRIRDVTGFTNVFIQPAAYDGGTSLGAAYYVYHQALGHPRHHAMDDAYLGPSFDERGCRRALEAGGLRFRRLGDDALVAQTARALADGRVVGWFQGRMEFGPRALGNRSILADPRRPEMKDILNERIKHREPFRPFAPSILEEATGDYFEDAHPSPFMLMAYRVRTKKRDSIPAPTHVDGTGRLQTVRREHNPRYYDLLDAFGRVTGVPVLVNTSFNDNEPICCTPEEAVETFRRTRMDILVLGNLYAEKEGELTTP
jgi:carbamoyltransferase